MTCRSDFYEWIKKVRKTNWTIKSLEQRREHFAHIWYSIGGPSFDQTGGHTNDPFYVKGMNALDKMLEIDKKLDELEPVIVEYNKFHDSLPNKYQLILDNVMFHEPSMVSIAYSLHCSRNMVYKLKDQLMDKWATRINVKRDQS